METTSNHIQTQPKSRFKQRAQILAALALSLLVQGAYFFDLVRKQLQVIIERQTALESLKVLAVPGTNYLHHISTVDIFKSSLFYLFLLGIMFAVFLLVSLLIQSFRIRGLYLFLGYIGLVFLLLQDRIASSFLIVLGLSFLCFYLLTMNRSVTFSIKEIILLAILTSLVSGSLYYGSRHKFFLKARDLVLFDTSLGNRIATFYYNHSVLAASLLHPDQGIYMGLIFMDGLKEKRPVYLGQGVFLSGDKKVKEAADYQLVRENGGLYLVGRYGNRADIGELNAKDIEEAARNLFHMKGFLLLNRAALYFFPAGCLILCLAFLKFFSSSRILFSLVSVGAASVLAAFILIVSLTGTGTLKEDIKGIALPKDALAIAYHLFHQREIPSSYLPVIEKMTRSESISLRYWGAYLLGRLKQPSPNPKQLLALLKDPSLNVRYTAAQSLYRILGKKSLNPLIVGLLKDPSWYVRCKIFSIFLKAGMIPSPA